MYFRAESSIRGGPVGEGFPGAAGDALADGGGLWAASGEACIDFGGVDGTSDCVVAGISFRAFSRARDDIRACDDVLNNRASYNEPGDVPRGLASASRHPMLLARPSQRIEIRSHRRHRLQNHDSSSGACGIQRLHASIEHFLAKRADSAI